MLAAVTLGGQVTAQKTAGKWPSQLMFRNEVCTNKGEVCPDPTLESVFVFESGEPGFQSYTNCELLEYVKLSHL